MHDLSFSATAEKVVAALDDVGRGPEIDLMGNTLSYGFHAYLLQFRGNLTRRIVKPKARQSVSKGWDRDDH